MSTPKIEEPQFLAAVDLLRRTGAKSFQIRYSDDEQPVVWIAVVEWQIENGVPVAKGGVTTWEADAGMSPTDAVMRLLVHVIDGGAHCKHCGRPTVVNQFGPAWALAEGVCWYTYDPESQRYERSCEESST